MGVAVAIPKTERTATRMEENIVRCKEKEEEKSGSWKVIDFREEEDDQKDGERRGMKIQKRLQSEFYRGLARR